MTAEPAEKPGRPGAMDRDLRELVNRARTGDPIAFRGCIDRFGNAVYRIAFQMVGNAEDARDIAQDVFMKLFRALHDYETEYLFSTWLYRITVNAAIDYQRKHGRHYHGSLEEVDHQTDAGSVNQPDRIAERSEFKDVITKLLEGLSPRQRQVFALRDLQDFSCGEIALILECSASTVRVHLAAARGYLRKVISTKYPEWVGGDHT